MVVFQPMPAQMCMAHTKMQRARQRLLEGILLAWGNGGIWQLLAAGGGGYYSGIPMYRV